MERKEAKQNSGKIVDVGTIDPGKCRTDHGWDNWHTAFANKLNATLGAAGVPIHYIICPEVEDSDNNLFWEDDERRCYQMPLGGQNFKHNNKLVYKLLKAACVDTNAWAWIQKNDPFADGRKAWLALVAHYDGFGDLNKRVQQAKMELLLKASLQRQKGPSVRAIRNKTCGPIPSTQKEQTCKLFRISTGGNLALRHEYN